MIGGETQAAALRTSLRVGGVDEVHVLVEDTGAKVLLGGGSVRRLS